MALIQCPKCGQQISDKATKCPHCGYAFILSSPNDVQQQHKNRLWVVVGSILVIIALCIGVGIYFFNNTHPTTEVKTQLVQENTTIREHVSPLTTLTFCIFDTEQGVMNFKKGNLILRSLEDLNFNKTSETESEINFGEDDYPDWRKIKNYSYERGEGQDYIKVKIEGIDTEYDQINNGFIEIVFSDKSQLNTFLSDAEKNNYKKVSSTSYQGPKYDEVYWDGTDLEIEGNSIIIRKRFHGD